MVRKLICSFPKSKDPRAFTERYLAGEIELELVPQGNLAERIGAPLELGPLFQQIFEDGAERYGPREWSPNIIKRLEEAAQVSVLAEGFPAQMVDDEPEVEGEEVRRTPAPAPAAE